MANIMQQKNVRNHVHRNGFDLSRKNAFTAKVGELLPCFVMETLPGDHIEIDTTGFTRTTPVDTAAYTRIKEYVDFYYVPYHLLWDKFNDWIKVVEDPTYAESMGVNAGSFSTSPYFTDLDLIKYYQQLVANESNLSFYNRGLDVAGLNRRQQSLKVMDLLGYGYFTNGFLKIAKGDTNAANTIVSPTTPTALSPWRILAYQKIYQDFYRDSQWEKARPWTYNLDYILSNDHTHIDVNTLTVNVGTNDSVAFSLYQSVFDMRYCNWNKDFVMGLQPNSAYEGTAFAGPLSGQLLLDLANNGNSNIYNLTINGSSGSVGVSLSGAHGVLSLSNDSSDSRFSDVSSGISVFALREAEALQKWREIAQSGSKDFKEQLKKHWNVDVSDEASNLCKWLGGHSDLVEISEVVNTNLANDGDATNIGGRGVGSHRGKIDFDARHYGVIIGIYHAVPMLDYSSNMCLDRQLTKVKNTDFAIPELDSIGLQEVHAFEVMSTSWSKATGGSLRYANLDNRIVGYAPRYVEYKTAIDKVFGGFSQSGYPSWVAPVDSSFMQWMNVFQPSSTSGDFGNLRSVYGYSTRKVSPYILNPIFLAQCNQDFDGTFGNDQLLCNYLFDTKVVRNLSESGLPY